MLLENQRRHPRLRSVGAVVLGYFTTLVLVVMTFFILGAVLPETLPTSEGETASINLLGLLLFISFGQAIVGGYVTATTAKRHEFAHGAALMGLTLLMGLISLYSVQSSNQPQWYALLTIGVGLIGILMGTYIRVAQKKSRNEDPDGGEPQSYHPAYRK